jgi:AraC-like DNA-binding protein
MSDTDVIRAYQQTEQPRPLPQALQIEHRGRIHRWILQHANLSNYRRQRRRMPVPAGHSHADSYHVLVYTAGEAEALLEGRVQPVRPGTLVLSAPGDVHDFRAISPGVTSYAQVTFALVDARDRPLALPFNELLGVWAGVDLPERGVVLQLGERPREELVALLARAFEAAEGRGATSHLEVRREVGAIFAFLLREVYLPPATGTGEGAAAEGLAAARAHVEAHYREKITVATLARLAYLSPGYFLRAFKRKYGISPIAYQLRLRVEAAQGMLRLGSLSCKQIAARLGYGDVYHFSKSFRKAVGCSPTDYSRRAGPV